MTENFITALPLGRLSRRRLPLSRFRFIDTCDPRAAHEAAVKLFAPNRLETPHGQRRFRAILHHQRLSALSLYFIRYEPEVVIRSGAMKRFYLLLVPLNGECRIDQGSTRMVLRPGALGVVNPLQPIALHWRSDCSQLVVKIDRAALERVVADVLGSPPTRPVEFASRPERQSDCPTLVRALDLIFRDADSPRPTVSSRLGEPPAETLFLQLLLRQMPNSARDALDRPASRAAPFYVRRVEEFIRLNAADPIRVRDMVAVAGASARALLKGFRDIRGMGPKAYLKQVRLDLVHQDLLQFGGRRTVTEIAAGWGCAHAGKFARDYRRRFGQSPSATRRRGRA